MWRGRLARWGGSVPLPRAESLTATRQKRSIAAADEVQESGGRMPPPQRARRPRYIRGIGVRLHVEQPSLEGSALDAGGANDLQVHVSELARYPIGVLELARRAAMGKGQAFHASGLCRHHPEGRVLDG